MIFLVNGLTTTYRIIMHYSKTDNMKLLYFIPALYNHGGMERVLTQKVNYLADLMDYDVCVVTTEQNHKPNAFSLSEKVRLFHLNLNFNHHYNQSLFFKLIYHYAKQHKYKKEIINILRMEKPDILISLGGKEIDFLYKLKTDARRICEMHFSMNVRAQFLESRKSGWVWKMLGQIRTNQLQRVTRKLDRLVVLTKQDYIQWKQTHRNVVHIVNPSPFNVPKITKSHEKVVIAVGRLDMQKGYEFLIDAWKLVAAKHPDWALHIWGSGDLDTMLRNKIRSMELDGQVNLKGVSVEIEKEYESASFFVMSSMYEGLPMVLLEAMAYGLPVVSFDCEWGPREVIEDGRNGFLIPVEDTVKLADKINLLIEDPELRDRMSDEAVTISQKFDTDIVMKQWDGMFKMLTGDKKYDRSY